MTTSKTVASALKGEYTVPDIISLLQIPNIGNITAWRLLKKFGTLENICDCEEQQLFDVCYHVNANKIFKFLKDKNLLFFSSNLLMPLS